MDGGEDSGGNSASDQIRSTLSFLDKIYGKSWRFSAWIVTHWDSDHHYGLYQFLVDAQNKLSARKYFTDSLRLYSGGSPPEVKIPTRNSKRPYVDIMETMVNPTYH